jgi:hypothetical protein
MPPPGYKYGYSRIRQKRFLFHKLIWFVLTKARKKKTLKKYPVLGIF